VTQRVFELARVLCQPRSEPIMHKWKSSATVSAPTPKKATAKRRRASGSSRTGDGASAKELSLAKQLKRSKKFASHSPGPSSAGVGHTTQAPTCALDLFDSGSSASDAKPADPVPAQKCLWRSSTPKTVSKPLEAFTANNMLEWFLFLRLFYSCDIELLLSFMHSLQLR
jgi:hypothetical protein